jgi:hypothetical protein
MNTTDTPSRSDFARRKHTLTGSTPYSAAALWDEVDGVHVDKSTSVLWYLKLATS